MRNRTPEKFGETIRYPLYFLLSNTYYFRQSSFKNIFVNEYIVLHANFYSNRVLQLSVSNSNTVPSRFLLPRMFKCLFSYLTISLILLFPSNHP